MRHEERCELCGGPLSPISGKACRSCEARIQRDLLRGHFPQAMQALSKRREPARAATLRAQA